MPSASHRPVNVRDELRAHREALNNAGWGSSKNGPNSAKATTRSPSRNSPVDRSWTLLTRRKTRPFTAGAFRRSISPSMITERRPPFPSFNWRMVPSTLPGMFGYLRADEVQTTGTFHTIQQDNSRAAAPRISQIRPKIQAAANARIAVAPKVRSSPSVAWISRKNALPRHVNTARASRGRLGMPVSWLWVAET